MDGNNYLELKNALSRLLTRPVVIENGMLPLNPIGINQVTELSLCLARLELKNIALKEKIDQLEEQLATRAKSGSKKMTIGEIALTFYYLFDEMGLNFANSHKTEWARFISRLTGKSYNRIREALFIEFERGITQRHLRNVACLFSELFPEIEQKVRNDLNPF